MRRIDLQKRLESYREKAASTREEMIKLLKTMGQNQRYSFTNQLLIYGARPQSKALCSYNKWKVKFNMQVSSGEQGVPIFKNVKGEEVVRYVFDFEQVKPTREGEEKGRIPRWEFDRERNRQTILDVLSQNTRQNNPLGYEGGDEIKFKLLNKATYLGNDFYNKNLAPLQNDKRKALIGAISISVSARLGLGYDDIFTDEHFKHLSEVLLNDNWWQRYFEYISSSSQEVIEDVMSLSQRLEKENEREYNLGSEKEKEMPSEKGEENVSGRFDRAREHNNDGSAGERTRGDNGRDDGEAGSRQGVHEGISDDVLRRHEDDLADGRRGQEEVRFRGGDVRKRRASGLSEKDRGESKPLVGQGDSTLDEEMGYTGQGKSILPDNAKRHEGSGSKGDNRGALEESSTSEVVAEDSKEGDYNSSSFSFEGDELIAVTSGYHFTVLPAGELEGFALIKSDNRQVRYNGKLYSLYTPAAPEGARRVDFLIDEAGFGSYEIKAYEAIDYELVHEAEEWLSDDEEEEQLSLEDIISGKEKEKAGNFELGEINYQVARSEERVRNNIEAIKTIFALEKGEIKLDTEVQKTLSKFSGWGGLTDVFAENSKFEKERKYLVENLSLSDYQSAKSSILTSYYTPNYIIDEMYKALENMGFKGGKILEPSCGIGAFIGRLPKSMSSSEVHGVELDRISGKIASYLYPESRIEISGFEKVNLVNNLFDLAISNVPFGDFKVYDKDYAKEKMQIHDYFIAKSVDKLRAGGIAAFITTSRTMDKAHSSARKFINKKAEFLGAVRLPSGTFGDTQVTTDIIFLKKRDYPLDDKDNYGEWLPIEKDKKGLSYNNYFVNHPNMVLGEMREVDSKYGTSLKCIRTDKENDIAASGEIAKALKEISDNAKYEEVIKKEDEEVVYAREGVKNYSFAVIGDEVYQREGSIMIPQKELTDKQKERIKAYITLKNTLLNQLMLERETDDEKEIGKGRIKLNEVYDIFVLKYGRVNSRTIRGLVHEDSDFPLVSSLEICDDKNHFKSKADIFFKRTINKPVVKSFVDTSLEALILSVSQRGEVDLDYMASITQKSKERVIKELEGEIFLELGEWTAKEINFHANYHIKGKTPYDAALEGEDDSYYYVTRDEYLSGDVVSKLEVARSYIAEYQFYTGGDYDDNRLEKIKETLDRLEAQEKELIEVQPEPVVSSEIELRLGTTWIPPFIIDDFIKHLAKEVDYYGRTATVNYDKGINEWTVGEVGYSWKIEDEYGTSKVKFSRILEATLNLRDVEVTKKGLNANGNETRVKDEEQTLLAKEKQEKIKDMFRAWVWQDEERREQLEKEYNKRFNRIRNREFDGSRLTFEGMSNDITLKTHQRNAIARVLYGGNTLLGHVVGAGKTFEMVASSMESKRLGMSSKSLFVVPNHIIEQTAREFMRLYPSASIISASKRDFEKDRRKRFISRIATSNCDAIIMGHSQFERIPMSMDYQEGFIQERIWEIDERLDRLEGDERENRWIIRRLESSKKKLEAKLEKLLDSPKDDVLTFEELGVDKLYIDEAHHYKNLYITTKMSNVAGIGGTESQKAADLFMKCRYLDEKTGSKALVFATGTPISNSMTEMYTMQRYLQYDYLDSIDCTDFDSWASTFGETVSTLELAPEGSGYRMKTRFSRFYNLTELMSGFKEIADIKTKDDVDLDVPEPHFELIETEASSEQKELLQILSDRAEAVREKSTLEGYPNDNMLVITTHGKQLALDQRLIDESLGDYENSKVNMCADKVYEIYEKTAADRQAQIVFCDQGIPNGKGFSVYDDLKNKLISRGVKEEEIAFIHDYKTDKAKESLFSKVRSGDVRVLIGSTSKMGTGTNVQDRLIAMHDLDVPWRPSDLEQRAGRIIRQGNRNKEVYIYRYITKGTFDAYLWQILENKQRFISQVFTSKAIARECEDIDEGVLEYAEIKALATGDERIKRKMELDTDVKRLTLLQIAHVKRHNELNHMIKKEYPNIIENLTRELELVRADIKRLEEDNILREGELVKDKDFKITLGDNVVTKKKEAGEYILAKSKALAGINGLQKIGEYKGFTLRLSYDEITRNITFWLSGHSRYVGTLGESELGNIERIDNAIKGIKKKEETLSIKLKENEEAFENAKVEVKKPWADQELLNMKKKELRELNRELNLDLEKEEYEADVELEEEIEL